jgi:hypothetical protein
MEGNAPFFMDMPSGVIQRRDVAKFRSFGPPGLCDEQPRPEVRTSAMDAAAGTTHYTVNGHHFLGAGGGDPFYMLLPSVFRCGQFLAGAARVVGVSGSTSEEDCKLPGRGDVAAPFFSMPWSQDPDLSETRIVPFDLDSHVPLMGGSAAQLDGGSGIWCHRREVIAGGGAGGPGGGLVSEVQVERYCAAVCSDIADIQSLAAVEEGAPAQRRPVLVFAPSLLRYLNARGESVLVRDRLFQVIRESGAVAESSLVSAPTDRDLTEAEIQRIGQAGYVTIADVKLGRGIDIRVSIDIPGGLHVIVATEVAHRRLLKQMIGRTGRLGREGSYSIIALDRIIAPQAQRGNEAWTGALHLASALGAHHLLSTQDSLVGEPRREWVCKWLLFLLASRQKSFLGASCIDRAHFKQLLPLSATEGSAAATAIRTRLSSMLGGAPL